MSDTPEKIDLEYIGKRLAWLTDQQHNTNNRLGILETRFAAMEHRFTALEARFSAIESRFTIQEDQQNRMLQIITRIAERLP